MPSTLDRGIEEWLARLDAGWQGAVDDLARGHAEVLGRIARTLSGLEADISLARAAGIEPSASWLFQQERYRLLESQVLRAIEGTAAQVAEVLPVLRDQGLGQGIGYADDVFRMAAPSLAGMEAFAALPADAIRAQVGFLQTDPIRALGQSIDPRQGWEMLSRRLVTGIATGESFRSVARNMVTNLSGLTLTRAMTITRTEMNRSFREGTLARWSRNDTITGWWWRAAIENATRPPCAVCMAKHGSIHPKSERMSSHPNCRCAPVPITMAGTIAVSGTPEAAEAALRARPVRQQRQVLGRSRWEAWSRGDLTLGQMIEDRTDPTWGVQPRLIPLRVLGLGGVLTGRTP